MQCRGITLKTFSVFVQMPGDFRYVGKVDAYSDTAAIREAKKKFPMVINPAVRQDANFNE